MLGLSDRDVKSYNFICYVEKVTIGRNMGELQKTHIKLLGRKAIVSEMKNKGQDWWQINCYRRNRELQHTATGTIQNDTQKKNRRKISSISMNDRTIFGCIVGALEKGGRNKIFEEVMPEN